MTEDFSFFPEFHMEIVNRTITQTCHSVAAA
jgi:hypothetical protein